MAVVGGSVVSFLSLTFAEVFTYFHNLDLLPLRIGQAVQYWISVIIFMSIVSQINMCIELYIKNHIAHSKIFQIYDFVTTISKIEILNLKIEIANQYIQNCPNFGNN